MKQQISTQNAPQAIGPYSQAVKVGNMVFCSGQIPLVPQTMEIAQGDVKVQTAQVFENIKAVLTQSGVTLNDVCKTTVFLQDMNDFASMNEVYAEAFEGVDVMPARSAVQVARLPKDVLVEIEVIAVV